ncbi:hypothetical protein B0H12DRAFT_361832 [Mycena haematopus]|nr:hypothetical protein B0H12DRAFT_361832 [Mycena haematopus]
MSSLHPSRRAHNMHRFCRWNERIEGPSTPHGFVFKVLDPRIRMKSLHLSRSTDCVGRHHRPRIDTSKNESTQLNSGASRSLDLYHFHPSRLLRPRRRPCRPSHLRDKIQDVSNDLEIGIMQLFTYQKRCRFYTSHSGPWRFGGLRLRRRCAHRPPYCQSPLQRVAYDTYNIYPGNMPTCDVVAQLGLCLITFGGVGALRFWVLSDVGR